MRKYEEARKIEISEGFDASLAEAALQAYMEKRLGGFGIETFESAAPGVIAFERLGWSDENKIDFDELEQELEKATGLEVVAIVDCEWSFDDKPDEKATYVSFNIPSLEESYKDTNRMLYSL